MPAFRYQQGDRPLDGYTIEYGLGRGGFGEVYFAVSDSGRHVALKAVQNYEEIELRGIRHCMNLKSPHLVTIFDVKFNDRGEPFVIMEYVSGPSLRGLLDEAPQGMGETKSAFFLQEIAKGLTYLHDQGIVHRDLKPHNVFYEDGFVKIGDYSLSKALSTSHRSGHTMTVGTVHYMAPEISMGRYDERVDIYALGIILYEMLRGQPPYSGQTMGEILMKHIAGEPDLRGMEEPFASAIRRALAKNPDDRFASAAEMAAAVFGARHIHDSVAEFNPQHLSLVAARIGAKVQAATAATLPPTDTPSPVAPAPRREPPVRSAATPELGLAYHTGRSLGLLAKHTGLVSLRRTYEADARQDTLDPRQRIGLAVLCVLALSIGCGLLGSQLGAWSGQGVSAWQVGIWALGAMAGGAASLMLASRWFGPALAGESALVGRLVLVAASWLGAWVGLLVVAPISELIGSCVSSLGSTARADVGLVPAAVADRPASTDGDGPASADHAGAGAVHGAAGLHGRVSDGCSAGAGVGNHSRHHTGGSGRQPICSPQLATRSIALRRIAFRRQPAGRGTSGGAGTGGSCDSLRRRRPRPCSTRPRTKSRRAAARLR